MPPYSPKNSFTTGVFLMFGFLCALCAAIGFCIGLLLNNPLLPLKTAAFFLCVAVLGTALLFVLKPIGHEERAPVSRLVLILAAVGVDGFLFSTVLMNLVL